jgi:hypothetical protein
MRCISCGEQMRLVGAVPAETMFVPGYEHHTLECLGCREVERRFVFRTDKGELDGIDVAATLVPPTLPDSRPTSAAIRSALPVSERQLTETGGSPAPSPPRAIHEPAKTGPESDGETVAASGPSRPQGPSPAWQRAIENLRSREIEISKRGELSKQQARALIHTKHLETKPLDSKVLHSKPVARVVGNAPGRVSRPQMTSGPVRAAPRVAAQSPVAAQPRKRRTAPLPSELDAEASKRFAEFWDNLIPRPKPAQSNEPEIVLPAPTALNPIAIEVVRPLPRSRSLVLVDPDAAMIVPAAVPELCYPKQVEPAREQTDPAVNRVNRPMVRAKHAMRRFTADAIRWGLRT